MAEIILKEITKRFDKTIAVNDLNMKIQEKEFLVLLGPSGCGKTTTLRCISGLEIPDEGRIYIDGEDVTTKRASQRDIAFVFQLYALYPHMNVYDNIAFPLLTQRVPRKRIKEEVDRAVKILRIGHILKKKPRELSGGDQQRVALGRALVRRPKAFLLDEPIGTLDAKFREEMRVELKKLHVDVGATTVYVTHDQVEAMSMGDRIAIMDVGVLQQIGTPAEVYRYPNNLFVANFIGSPGMNFMKCKTYKKDGRVFLNILSVDQSVEVNERLQRLMTSKGFLDKEVILGVRPEDVVMSLTEKADYVTTKVYVIEATGSYNIIDVVLDSSEKIRVRTLSTVAPDINDKVYLNFDMDRVSVFDPGTEESIKN
jgi:multiple sugar transport system ATP-binding protein